MFGSDNPMFIMLTYVLTISLPLVFIIISYKDLLKYKKMKPIKILLKFKMSTAHWAYILFAVLCIAFFISNSSLSFNILKWVEEGTIFYVSIFVSFIYTFISSTIVTNKGIIVLSLLRIPLYTISWDNVKSYKFESDGIKIIYIDRNKEKEMFIAASFENKMNLEPILDQYL
jgi:hypothetical protein